ncbi:MAG: tripartite tricarboxylate transporter TctB family protein [Proteobacteria bacterium]|nr:tripartite tricarboxylate transporter TctB family protein [Pseudomonadota bacterium]
MTARGQDATLGLLFVALGLAAAWQAAGYRGASGTYPLVLGLSLAALGLLLALKSFWRGAKVPRPLVDHPGRVAVTVAIGAGYLALVPVLGFYAASALVAVLLPVALGFRRPVYTLLAAAGFMAVVWLVFTGLLAKPLPTGFWSGW